MLGLCRPSLASKYTCIRWRQKPLAPWLWRKLLVLDLTYTGLVYIIETLEGGVSIALIQFEHIHYIDNNVNKNSLTSSMRALPFQSYFVLCCLDVHCVAQESTGVVPKSPLKRSF